MKIVLNYCFGGFGISKELIRYLKFYNLNVDTLFICNIKNRSNEVFVNAIEEFKDKNLPINDEYSSLRIFQIPDDFTDIKFTYYDGSEGIIYVKNGKLYNEFNEPIGEN